MNIVHLTAECYPVAKAGGLGDVAGALPKYLQKHGHDATVILPCYHNNWMRDASARNIHEGSAMLGLDRFDFRILELKKPQLGFRLLLVDIPGRFDRPGIYIDPWSGYSYWDEKERFFSFQIAALDWLLQEPRAPDVIHCHDHHTALVPFMTNQAFRYEKLRDVPTILTIHNGEYQGKYDRQSYTQLPAFNLNHIGLLDWDGALNSLAAGIKTAWKVTTVSEGYMKELTEHCNGLEHLLRSERDKTAGILNGIDDEVWDPHTDPLIGENYSLVDYRAAKKKNKDILCGEFGLDPERPLFSFIGRLVREKGADLLPDLIRLCKRNKVDASFLVLGTGEPALHDVFKKLRSEFVGYFDSKLEYNEKLAHQIYAGSDFLLMPSRVEPCGLNQLYAMRYGTIPLVRKTGGLADTVIDIDEKKGYGLVFEEPDVEEMAVTVRRGVDLFAKKQLFGKKRKQVMKLDFSWNKASEKYLSLYDSLTKNLSP